ncbi:MAG: uracil-DNA glycosylase [Campylobacteraceae bacterium]|jgi:DNA polymerase|nr:uracil-DNA glycosylase [Campylobacteraceae bacterium]
MSKLETLKMLRELYIYRSYGFTYYKKREIESKKPSVSVPNNIDELRKSTLSCFLCSLCKTRKNVVFGEGSLNAKVMFIGEGPGFNEDLQGRPFVGKAGELLTKMIENVLNIKRNEAYIANIVKCRPPENRVPTPEEANMCKPYLFKQIEIISPQIIVALGNTSYHYLTGDERGITKVRGEIIEYKNAKLIPTFHPSYLLRNESAKKEAYQDMLRVKALL